MTLRSRVSRFARRHSMWRPDTRVIAAVSGGSDSVALLCLLHDLDARGELILDAVAHLNHTIRGDASDEDQTFCRDLATSLNVPFEAARVNVIGAAQRERLSIEVAARRARREFLDQVRGRRSADAVATAHTQDDQAETVLLRLMRGSGLRGLGGIAPIREDRIRPLLTCSRQELRDELTARGQRWRDDATNADVRHPRNRVRHELLPYLERHFNPAVRAALGRVSDLARSDDLALTREAVAAALHVARIAGDTTRLDARALETLPEAIARRVVQDAMETAGGTSYGSEAIEAVRAVARKECPAVDLLGLRVEHSSGSVVLHSRGPARLPALPFAFDLPVPGAVQSPDAEWVLEAKGPQARGDRGRAYASGDEVEVDAAEVSGSLIVRSWRPGDRVRPLGLGGHKKLQDVFVDRKVTRGDRDRVPLVTDKKDRIVWVAGHLLAEEFRVTDHTKAVIILKLRRIERSGT